MVRRIRLKNDAGISKTSAFTQIQSTKHQGIRRFYRKPVTFFEGERTFPILDTKFAENDLYPQRWPSLSSYSAASSSPDEGINARILMQDERLTFAFWACDKLKPLLFLERPLLIARLRPLVAGLTQI